MQRTECLNILNSWIVQVKNKKYIEYLSSENVNGLEKYKNSLENLESELKIAIVDQDKEKLENLEWPNELMECIEDMNIRTYILDSIQQAFTINHFNKSPQHEEELNENKIL